MVSDVIHVSSGGEGVAEALLQAERTAAFYSLPRQDALRLRLFAEEALGMMRALTGERHGDFRVEAENGRFSVILRVETPMSAEKREKLLSVSSSGQNDAAKGFMGKIKDLFERAFEYAGDPRGYYDAGAAYSVLTPGAAGVSPGVWTLTDYREAASAGALAPEEWDALEHSVVAKLADEVRVSLGSRFAELVIEKTF